MAGSLRKEIDALMKAEVEQNPAWHEAMADPAKGDEPLDVRETVAILLAWDGALRRAVLRIADEVDRLKT